MRRPGQPARRRAPPDRPSRSLVSSPQQCLLDIDNGFVDSGVGTAQTFRKQESLEGSKFPNRDTAQHQTTPGDGHPKARDHNVSQPLMLRPPPGATTNLNAAGGAQVAGDQRVPSELLISPLAWRRGRWSASAHEALVSRPRVRWIASPVASSPRAAGLV